MDEEDYFKIKPIAIFVSLFYTKVFLWSRIAGFSHIDDLVFIGAMTWYKNGCKEIADAAILSCKRHFWYLTEELVVLFILNEKVVACTVYNLYFIRIRNMKLFKPVITKR